MTNANSALCQSPTIQLGHQCVRKVLDLCNFEELLEKLRNSPSELSPSDDVFFIFDAEPSLSTGSPAKKQSVARYSISFSDLKTFNHRPLFIDNQTVECTLASEVGVQVSARIGHAWNGPVLKGTALQLVPNSLSLEMNLLFAPEVVSGASAGQLIFGRVIVRVGATASMFLRFLGEGKIVTGSWGY